MFLGVVLGRGLPSVLLVFVLVLTVSAFFVAQSSVGARFDVRAGYGVEDNGLGANGQLEKTAVFNPFVSRPQPVPENVREYLLTAEDRLHEVAPKTWVTAWTLNGMVPGPVITALEGEKVRVKFVNKSPRPQTLHFHGIHQPQFDGVHEIVAPGGEFVYELEASPPGLYLYHSHMLPIAKQQNQGFFGAYIVYPKNPLPPAKEVVLIMQFVDTDGDFEEAEFYAVNGRADQFMNSPIEAKVGETIRVFLINMNIEFGTFHIHANVFRAFMGLGMDRSWHVLTDNIGLGWGERAVLEFFSYNYPGLYMFHDHIGEHSELGLRGWFKVVPAG